MEPAFGGAVAASKAEQAFKWGCGLVVALIIICVLGWFLWAALRDDTPPDYGDAVGQVYRPGDMVVDGGATWDCSKSPDVHRVVVGSEVIVVDSEPTYGCKLVAITD